MKANVCILSFIAAVWSLVAASQETQETAQETAQETPQEITLSSIPSPLMPLVNLVASRFVEDLFGITKEEPTWLFPENMAILQSASGAQTALRRELLRRAAELHRSRHATHLLAVAFTGQTHLPWAAFAGLPVAVLRAALQHPGMHQAQSISLCIDTIQGDTVQSTAAQIVEALSAAPATFRYLCFHQMPQRTDDDCTTQLYTHLAASSLLQKGVRLTLTGACSAALRNRMWFPTSSSVCPAFHAFPVQHMFIRSQVTDRTTVGNNNNKAFLPVYTYMADTLLPSEVFAASFLVFLSGIVLGGIDMEEQASFLFAHSASTLTELAIEPAEAIARGFQVALPAAENLAIPICPFEKYSRISEVDDGDDPDVAAQERKKQLADIECWPLVRDPVPGSWTVLVSYERRDKDSHALPDEENYYDDVVVRYAFIRAGDNGQVDVVGDLKAFLKETASEIDGNAVEQRLTELDSLISQKANSSNSSQRRPDRRILDLDKNEALDLLSAFLEDARTYGRDTLRAFMQEGMYDAQSYSLIYADEL